MTALLASLWIIPAASAAVSFIAGWFFGGDWTMGLIAAVTVGAAVLAGRMLGWKAAAGILLTGAMVLARRSGENAGYTKREQEAAEETDRLISKAEKAAAEADRHNANPDNLRNDDGWRRD